MKKLFSGLLITMLFLLSCDKANSKSSKNWVAKVEDQVITLEEFEKTFDLMLKLNFTEGQGALIKEEPEYKKQVIENMIVQKLILKDLEKNNIIKKEALEYFELKALSQYFIQKRVLDKIDIPSDTWIKSKYDELKKEIDKRGITNYEDAKKLIVNEYQKGKYVITLRDEMKKLKANIRLFTNDEFEQDAINKYLQNKLKAEDFEKTWLFKIATDANTQVYNVSDVEKFMKVIIETTYGAEGVQKYEKDEKIKANFRSQLFQDYFAALLVQAGAKAEKWMEQPDYKDYVTIFVNNAKTQYYLKLKIAPTVEQPTEEELKTYYEVKKAEIKQPYEKVKESLIYAVYNEKGKYKAEKFLEKKRNESKYELNPAYFDAKKSSSSTSTGTQASSAASSK